MHTEIEGGRGDDFALRMYRYHYRIFDLHSVSVESVAFFTGGKNQPRPAEYRHRTIETSIHFRYLAYHVLQHSEAELLAMDNVFALVVLACQKALLEGKVADEALGNERLAIARELFRRNYNRDRVRSILHFLKNMLYVRNPEINSTFEQEVRQFSGGQITMGVIEYLIEQAKQEGLQKGWQEAQQKAEAEKMALAKNLKNTTLSPREVASLLGMPVEQIEKL